MDERGIAELISKQGANGVGCFASAATIGKLAHRERKSIERTRRKLFELGWFTQRPARGGTTGRAMVLDVAMPGAVPDDTAESGYDLFGWPRVDDAERAADGRYVPSWAEKQ
jgi:hypothetical protein